MDKERRRNAHSTLNYNPTFLQETIKNLK